VRYPQLTIYLRQLKYSVAQPTIYPTTDFLKHLIIQYSFEIKQINERKIMFLSHNNVFFIIKSKSKLLINSLKSAYNLAYLSYILIDTFL
jgi:hypothetical protein